MDSQDNLTARFMVGDVFDKMAELADGSVDLILTSPPFLALRSYLPPGHPDKAKEIGSEASPAEFIDTMLALTAEWDRLLAPHGTLAVELGDTYSGHDNRGSTSDDPSRDGHSKVGAVKTGPGWPLAKSATLIPEVYRVALAYGINPLTGQTSPAGEWRIRNTVTWVRPNPPVGALGDKFRPATSDMVIACKSKTRWFDLDAVRTENSRSSETQANHLKNASAQRGDRETNETIQQNPAGAPPLDWWEITTGGYKGSHYATFPPELLVRPIKAMCPLEVCRTCGKPRRRITSTPVGYGGDKPSPDGHRDTTGQGHHGHRERAVQILGFTDCGHGNYRRGLVLDPFAGSGTTLMVAVGHGRDAIGIDLDERNADLAVERCGMFLEVA